MLSCVQASVLAPNVVAQVCAALSVQQAGQSRLRSQTWHVTVTTMITAFMLRRCVMPVVGANERRCGKLC